MSDNEPLAYVNVGVIGTSYGAMTDEEGNFKFSIDSQNISGAVRFSIIGYKSLVFLLTQFIEMGEDRLIKMERAIYELEEVTVDAFGFRQRRVGSRISGKRTVTGWEKFPAAIGGEREMECTQKQQPGYLFCSL